jgi:hypothetical protein
METSDNALHNKIKMSLSLNDLLLLHEIWNKISCKLSETIKDVVTKEYNVSVLFAPASQIDYAETQWRWKDWKLDTIVLTWKVFDALLAGSTYQWMIARYKIDIEAQLWNALSSTSATPTWK